MRAQNSIMKLFVATTSGDRVGVQKLRGVKSSTHSSVFRFGYPGGIKEYSPALGKALRWVRQFVIPTLKGLNREGEQVSKGCRYTAANVRFKKHSHSLSRKMESPCGGGIQPFRVGKSFNWDDTQRSRCRGNGLCYSHSFGVRSEAAVWDRMTRSPRLFFWLSLAVLCAGLAGCSTVPPRPVPLARQQAIRQAETAAKLSQAENWAAAAPAWQNAADRFALLNDRAGEAMAWHNYGQAQNELGDTNAARNAFEQAAQINTQLRSTNAWWRNQLALVQMEIGDTNAAAARFKTLAARPVPAELAGYYQNELGRWQTEVGDYSAAARSFAMAQTNFQHEPACLAAVSLNRAALLTRQHSYPAALAEWRAARAAFEALSDPLGIARALLGEGQSLLESGENLPLAETLLRQAARNFATLNRTADHDRALALLAQCIQSQKKS